MNKKLLKSILVVACAIMGGQNVWSQVVSWNYDKNATYTAEQELSTNTELVSVTLGNGTWFINNSGRSIEGIASDEPTFENGIPTTGSYLIIKPTKDVSFSLTTGTLNNYSTNLIEASDPNKNLGYSRPKNVATSLFPKLEAGKTYYFYGNSYKTLGDKVAFRQFVITSYEKYTISYQLSDGTKIANDVEHTAYYGTNVTATDDEMQPIEYEGSNYVYVSGNEDIVLNGTKTITLIYKQADLSSYTIKYLDESNNEIKDAITTTAPIGSSVSATASDLATFYSSDLSKKYVYNSGNNKIIISNNADNNIISLIYKTYDKANYKVVAKHGNNVIGEVATGETYTDWTDAISISKYFKHESVWYKTNNALYIELKSEIVNVDFEPTDITYFSEAENMSDNTGSSINTSLSNGASTAIRGNNIAKLTTLQPGKYLVGAYIQANGFRGLFVRDVNNSDNSSNSLGNIANNNTTGELTLELTLDKETTIGVSGYTNSSNQTNQSADFDYIYIKALSIPASISAAKFATFIPSYNIVAQADVKAYTVKVNTDKTGIELNEIAEGTVIPAGTPLLLNAAEGSYDFAVSTDDAAEITNNDLVAATADVTATGNEYALTKQGDVVGFAPVKADVVIPAGKAYLQVDNSNDDAAKFMSIIGGGDATGINTVNATNKTNDAYYTLQGVKTMKPAAKGVYILNGKKVIVNK